MWVYHDYELATLSFGLELVSQGRWRVPGFGFIAQGCRSCFALDLFVRRWGSSRPSLSLSRV